MNKPPPAEVAKFLEQQMNKFKFGDRVWHEEYGLGVVTLTGEYLEKPVCTVELQSGNVNRISCTEDKLALETSWISCIERLPEHDTAVLTYNSWSNNMECEFLRYSDDKQIAWWSTTQESSDVTHWMPLPAPPQD